MLFYVCHCHLLDVDKCLKILLCHEQIIGSMDYSDDGNRNTDQ